MAEYQSVDDPKVTRTVTNKKPPGFIVEAAFCSVSLLMIKLFSDPLYSSITFTTVLLPMMIFFIFSIVFNILKFLKLLHIEE